jgi:hypothetical protein
VVCGLLPLSEAWSRHRQFVATVDGFYLVREKTELLTGPRNYIFRSISILYGFALFSAIKMMVCWSCQYDT